jgi:hypothetical protein
VTLTIAKNNNGPTGDVHWFKRVSFDSVGFLEPVTLIKPTAAKAVADLAALIVAFVGVHRGQYSKTKLRDTQAGKTRSPLFASKGDVEAAIETLLADGRLVNRPPSDAERNTFGHGRHVKHVLDIGALGTTPALPPATRRLRTPSLCQQHNRKRGTKF